MSIPFRQHGADDRAPDGRTPRRCRVLWDSGTASAVEGRNAASGFLSELQKSGLAPLPDQVVGDVRLVVSELVTNALRHAPGVCSLQVDLSGDGRAVRVAVQDPSPRTPRLLPRDALRVGGHGLEIVRAVSRSVSVHPSPYGKQVTAEIAIPQPAGTDSVPG
jgi:anti-sigma regulatory factor (Ser/Thr protein kinase)